MAGVLIDRVSKQFAGVGKESVSALRDLVLKIDSGELLVLFGPSGSGKTTLLRIIAGLEQPTSGNLVIDGKVANDIPPQDRSVAMVFQEHALYPHLTVFENLAFGLKLRRASPAEIDQRVRAAAELLKIAPLFNRAPATLSGGERQRVALGRAMVQRPKLLLLDEPLSNLDARLRLELRREIAQLHHRLGLTTIYVTHDQVEAMTLGTRIAVIKSGALQQIAAPLEIYRNPANLFVAGFIGAPPMNLFSGTAVRKDNAIWFQVHPNNSSSALAFRAGPETAQDLAGYCGKEVTFGIRPENIHVTTPTDATGHSVPVLEAVIAGIEPFGSETHLYLAAGSSTFVVRVPGDYAARLGQIIRVRFDLAKGRFFEGIEGNTISHPRVVSANDQPRQPHESDSVASI